MLMGLYTSNGKNPVAQLWGCHDLLTADREFALKRTAIAYLMYSTEDRNQFRSRSLHILKRKPSPFECSGFYWHCEYHKGT